MKINSFTYNVLLIASISSLLYSCNTPDYDSELTSDSDNVALLSISAIINSTETSRKASLDSNTFEEGDVVGLFILDSNHEAYRGDSSNLNLPAEFNGSGFDLSADVILTDEDAYVYAYYPYNSEYGNSYPSSAVSGIETEFIFEDGLLIDLLITGEPVIANYENKEAALSFYHGLSRLVFSFNLDDTLGEGLLSFFSLASTNNDLCSSAYFYFDDILTLGLNENSSTFTNELTFNLDDAILSSSSSYQFEMLIIPSSVSGKSISFVFDGMTYNVDLPTSEVSEWLSGVQYNYSIPITPSDDDDDITYFLDEGITAVDLGLSVKWASCNVGASEYYEYGDFFAWGETETKDSFDGPDCSTYGVSLSDISGNSQYDAATANWGDNWRMPTLDEYMELYESVSAEWITISGMTGFLLTGFTGNSIFFPVDIEAPYWTSTPYDSFCAYQVVFNEEGDAFISLYNEKGFPGYIRPVCDY